MAHKGLNEFTGDETGNLFLGQTGFHIISGAGATTAASKGVNYWVAIKAIDGAAGFQANTLTGVPGDDLAENGTYSVMASNNIDLADGDIVYGVFDTIYMDSASEFVLAYIGR